MSSRLTQPNITNKRKSDVNSGQVLATILSRGIKFNGLSLKQINNASKIKVCLKPIFCVICQENSEKYDIKRELKCKHEFHAECIDEWLLENNNCPLCKKSLIKKNSG